MRSGNAENKRIPDERHSKLTSSEAILAIKQGLASAGFSRIKSDQTVAVITKARKEYSATFAALPLHPQAERFSPAQLDEAPWRKVAIGATNGLGDPYAQFLQTTYFSEHSRRHPNLSDLFRTLISLRNALTGMPDDFGADGKRDGFWNACRIHHYPNGGGFMSRHQDTYFPSVMKSRDIPFVQVMACLSARGADFEVGGGVLCDRAGNTISLDDEESFGSVVAFDGAVVHGVDTVDAHLVPDFGSPRGRIVAFVNLYTFAA
jgi:hypothetical protein